MTNSVFSPLQSRLLTGLLILVVSWLSFQFLGYVGELISILVTSGLIAFLLNYAVAKLERFIPRGIAAALVYLIAIVTFVIIALTLVPPVFNQGRQLITRLPELIESGRQQLAEFQVWSADRNLPFDVGILQQQLLSRIQGTIEPILTGSLGLVLGTFNWFFDLIFILVIAFYMLLDGERLWNLLITILSPQIREVLTFSLERNLKKFVLGQTLQGIFMAVTLTVAFLMLKVPYFLLFAVVIGLLEIIPFVGATLGIGTVTIIVAFIDWWLALQVLAVAVAIQQVKDNIVAPRIMGDLTGLSPVIIFSALLLGGKIGGLLGFILAIPMAGVIKSIIEVVVDPTLPPQTGSFFYNPLDSKIDLTPTETLSLAEQERLKV
ncbi:AI-2E family transporter [Planktothrix pseudagardhii]|uniref:Transport protein sll0063 n=1 Tax=Planktothrix pseudagardhii TaxID=132604 RepID=A0A9W4G6D7_9CYAN|nr:AI-2E family transporter [Planktothrix pseudagardhii]CAD5957389.1 Putative transport protein sll0063 [Planktothrix pseudagardhii]